jgi:nucleotide-binding universal stress UspA family protein
MNAEKVTIVVPTDFTRVADVAVEHAIGLCKSINNSEIVLLHIIGKEKEKVAAEIKMKEQSENLTKKSGINVSYEARIGNIFDDIGAAANDLKAKLIIMGNSWCKRNATYYRKLCCKSNYS